MKEMNTAIVLQAQFDGRQDNDAAYALPDEVQEDALYRPAAVFQKSLYLNSGSTSFTAPCRYPGYNVRIPL